MTRLPRPTLMLAAIAAAAAMMAQGSAFAAMAEEA